MLDIGGGIGLASYYAAAKNANKVDLIEPLGDGSGSVLMEKNKRMKYGLPGISTKVNHINKTFQEFFSDGEKYDIILLHNSINHLNEQACINLLINETSMRVYDEYFQKLNSLINDNGKIIIADCSNKNFFNSLCIKNPLAWSIEWEKHQHPNTWSTLLKKAGFTVDKILWSSPKQLFKFGQILFSNTVMAYFTFSHFIIHGHKK